MALAILVMLRSRSERSKEGGERSQSLSDLVESWELMYGHWGFGIVESTEQSWACGLGIALHQSDKNIWASEVLESSTIISRF